MSPKTPVFILASLLMGSVSHAAEPAANTLTPEEKRQGFSLLFDGKATQEWRGFNRTEMPAAGWKVEEETLTYDPVCSTCEKPGDIVTKRQFENFELRLDWKISAKANSGVKYLVNESLVKTGHAGLGFEMQILDNQEHPDAKLGVAGNRTAGGLYDLIPPSVEASLPVGQWNQVQLIVNGAHVEHWLNGQRVVQFERGCQMMQALISNSKYKDKPGFGEAAKGHVLLQEHGDKVWFRNIRVRTLAGSNLQPKAIQNGRKARNQRE